DPVHQEALPGLQGAGGGAADRQPGRGAALLRGGVRQHQADGCPPHRDVPAVRRPGGRERRAGPRARQPQWLNRTTVNTRETHPMERQKTWKRVMLLSALSSFLLLTIGGSSHAQADRKAGADPQRDRVFRAGAATSNITPPLGEGIVGGFSTPIATHIHDEL